MARQNINRGFKKLRVWQDAVALYVLACKILIKFPFELKKVASNAIDASHSISRTISEGYCRRSLNEYLNYLNYSLGSCGEFHSCYESFKQAGQITDDEYENLDKLHFKVENSLLKLIESLQKKQREASWEDTFTS
jgi:four helix bundle protein